MPLVNVAVNLPRGDFMMRFDLDPDRPTEGIILSYLKQGALYEPEVATLFTRAIQAGDTVAGCWGEYRHIQRARVAIGRPRGTRGGV
jgi:hypothetical protein